MCLQTLGVSEKCWEDTCRAAGTAGDPRGKTSGTWIWAWKVPRTSVTHALGQGPEPWIDPEMLQHIRGCIGFLGCANRALRCGP